MGKEYFKHVTKSTYLLFIVLSVLFTACQKDKVDKPDEEEPPQEEEPVTFTFTPSKKAALFDMTMRYGDPGDRLEKHLYSARYMLDIAGMPYIETQTLSKAMEGSLILLSSPILDGSFSIQEIDSLKSWVENGGVLISPCCKSQAMASLFGISSFSYHKKRHAITWIEGNYPELSYFDAPEEKTISLGKRDLNGDAIKSYGYTLDGGSVLAHFDSGEPSVVKKESEKGRTYLFGVEWRDVIQRPQLNKDMEAQRQYSNSFEPSADVFPLFVRSVWNTVNKVSAWKYTIPDGFQSIVMPTHDIDSRTGYDSMYYIADYEKSIGLKAHFFMTTHYFRDDILSPFYDSKSIEKAKKILAAGHTVGSHSTGHFPDFMKNDRFPKGDASVTKETYQPYYHSDIATTTGGNTYGEVYLSKKLLDDDLKTNVRAFRSGHLCVNSTLAEVLDESGYSFSSSFSACDVLTAFPYFERRGYAWERELTSVLQIPMYISDVFTDISELNYPDKVAIWDDVSKKLIGNYAPCVLLIHPNRKWKMQSLELFVSKLDRTKCGLYNFQKFGDFWLARTKFTFDFYFDEEQALFVIKAPKSQIVSSLGIVVETSEEIKRCVVVDEDDKLYPVSVTTLSNTRKLVTIK